MKRKIELFCTAERCVFGVEKPYPQLVKEFCLSCRQCEVRFAEKGKDVNNEGSYLSQ